MAMKDGEQLFLVTVDRASELQSEDRQFEHLSSRNVFQTSSKGIGESVLPILLLHFSPTLVCPVICSVQYFGTALTQTTALIGVCDDQGVLLEYRVKFHAL